MVSLKQPKMRREDLKSGEVLCDYCTAKCCQYFALPIDTPEDEADYQYLRWYLLHKHATVFSEDETWYLLVHTPCKHLQEDNRCGIYETRPQICRDYTTDQCEYDDTWVYERYLETAEQVEEFMDAILPAKKGASIRGRKPELLPILSS